MFINIWKGLTRTLNWVIHSDLTLLGRNKDRRFLKLCGCNERPAEYLRFTSEKKEDSRLQGKGDRRGGGLGKLCVPLEKSWLRPCKHVGNL